MAELTEVFSRMMKTPCAISKLEYLLEAVRLTYENVKDAKQPKKSMNDLGADGECSTVHVLQFTVCCNIREHFTQYNIFV